MGAIKISVILLEKKKHSHFFLDKLLKLSIDT